MADNVTDFNGTDEFRSNIDTAPSVIWLLGISVSTLSLLLQVLLYVLIPISRKLDQKILTQLSVTRLLNTVLEYIITYATYLHPIVRDATFALYMQTDSVLILWMFVFSKNLHDKVVVVFGLQKYNFILLSILIWILTLPIGLMCPLLLYFAPDHFETMYRVYSVVKFIVLTVNLVCFIRVYCIAINRGRRNAKQLKDILRTCVIYCVLVCIACLQVLVTDLLSYFNGDNEIVNETFCIINSYQVVAMTFIFVALTKSVSEDSLLKSVATKAATKWSGCCVNCVNT